MQRQIDPTDELDTLLSLGSVRPHFQPVVDLATGDTVGFEALTRGPVGSPLQLPGRLFETARDLGRLAELDRLCQARALEDAEASGLHGPYCLFLNVEPAAATRLDLSVASLVALRERGVRPVLELTERDLIDDPARLIGFADWARSVGWSVALDDVGANSDSLALMPFLRPEFVKLDLRLVQRRPDAAVAEIMTAVTAYAEESEAHILAEGIETEVHEYTARSLGATLGQGWRYGRPALLVDAGELPAPRRPVVLRPADQRPVSRSPYEAATRSRASQRGSKSLLVAVSRLLEDQAAELHGQVVVLAAFERASWFTPAIARRYAALATSAALVVALGAGMSLEPAPGVRGADLAVDDPLLGEWTLVVIAPHFSAALVARDLHDHGPDRDRTFDYVLTYDRDIVVDAARSVMSRSLPVVAPAAG